MLASKDQCWLILDWASTAQVEFTALLGIASIILFETVRLGIHSYAIKLPVLVQHLFFRNRTGQHVVVLWVVLSSIAEGAACAY